MSKKANVFLSAAAVALGVTLTAGAVPVSEALLNDYTVKAVNIAQVDDAGRCVVIVTVAKDGGADEVRAVAASSGDVRVFADFGGTSGLISKAKMNPACVVTYKRKLKEVNLGDPIAKLKQLYKSFKAEKATALKQKTDVASEITAVTALGYNTAVGTPEAVEYADLLNKQTTITEWFDFASARVTALAASLTAAGVDPATVV